mmetsp:Transcript_56056/g.137717  ORF Transcript_56056/g.137717 Transcript_56056/m.137717 type:complete len:225 (-) Transcript_56056:425-1099(-)
MGSNWHLVQLLSFGRWRRSDGVSRNAKGGCLGAQPISLSTSRLHENHGVRGSDTARRLWHIASTSISKEARLDFAKESGCRGLTAPAPSRSSTWVWFDRDWRWRRVSVQPGGGRAILGSRRFDETALVVSKLIPLVLPHTPSGHRDRHGPLAQPSRRHGRRLSFESLHGVVVGLTYGATESGRGQLGSLLITSLQVLARQRAWPPLPGRVLCGRSSLRSGNLLP